MVAIRAGQASAVELLARHGAPLDGGGSQRLASADGHAPSSAREKIVARRCGCSKVASHLYMSFQNVKHNEMGSGTLFHVSMGVYLLMLC